MGKRRRGSERIRKAKAELRALLRQHPKIKAGEKISDKEAFEYVEKENPRLLEVLNENQIRGVLGYLLSPFSKVAGGSPGGKGEAQAKTPGADGGSKGRINPPGEDAQGTENPDEGPGPAGSPGDQRKPSINTPGRGGVPAGIGVPPEIGEEGARVIQRELWEKATPIIRKVVLNPKVFLYYDYMRANYGYKGDLGDFLYDCVEDFFRSRGFTVKIVKEEELA